MVKIQRTKSQFLITLPSQIARLKDWNKGDELVFKIDNKGTIFLDKLKKEK